MDPDDIDLSELEPRVADWIDADPDLETAGELQDLLARANCEAPEMATGNRDEALLELHDRFSQFLEFGTAGLRGPLGGGPNRMNRAVRSEERRVGKEWRSGWWTERGVTERRRRRGQRE